MKSFDLSSIVTHLAKVPGVRAISLGGSRARGTAAPDSDFDLGMFYQKPEDFDLEALNALCHELDDDGSAQATPIGGWGPWVDGGVWLTVAGQRVDFIYRDLGRVERSVQDALAGKIKQHAQTGHPHGIHSHHYAAELALGQILFDPDGELLALKSQLSSYPAKLQASLIAAYGWQPEFWLHAATKALARGDVLYAQGCTYHAVMAMVQTLCARNQVWLANEKGSLILAGAVPDAPKDFTERVNTMLHQFDLKGLQHIAEELN